MSNNMYEEEETIKIQPEDFIKIEYYKFKDGSGIGVKITPKVPKSLSNSTKGKIGEIIVKIILDLYRTDSENLVLMQKAGHTFDILDEVNNVKYDVKLSPMHSYQRRKCWEFSLATNKPSRDAMKISDKKYMKDYKESCDYLVLVGVDEDFSIKMFMIPTDSLDFKKQSKITIPQNCKGIYAKYLVDLNDVPSSLPGYHDSKPGKEG